MHRESFRRSVDLVLDRVGALFGGLELHEAADHDSGQPFWLCGLAAAEAEGEAEFAYHVSVWIADPVRRNVLIASVELFCHRQQSDRDDDGNRRWEFRYPGRVDAGADDRAEVVVHLDVPARDDPVDVHPDLRGRLLAGR